MNNPWDVRPRSSVGDREPNVLFAAIGEALTEWENVESSLANVFAVFVSARGKSTFWQPAIQAYGSIVSFKNRCEMLRVAGDAFFSTRKNIADRQKLFQQLVGEAGNYSARRNEIAHGQVSEMHLIYEAGRRRSGGFFLFPSLFNPKKHKKGTGMTYSYVSGDLYHYRQEFTKLHLRIEGFCQELTSAKRRRN